jgi:hypothetical protein
VAALLQPAAHFDGLVCADAAGDAERSVPASLRSFDLCSTSRCAMDLLAAGLARLGPAEWRALAAIT